MNLSTIGLINDSYKQLNIKISVHIIKILRYLLNEFLMLKLFFLNISPIRFIEKIKL